MPNHRGPQCIFGDSLFDFPKYLKFLQTTGGLWSLVERNQWIPCLSLDWKSFMVTTFLCLYGDKWGLPHVSPDIWC